ncbi:MAG: TolC family protein [Deltaproteobacteria bacterium]|nr:TolC family protein [Deltaproteobacteria bacterium]
MRRLHAAVLCAALASAWPRAGAAQQNALTLDEALSLARERAPTLLAARARIDEARGRLVGASVLLRANPVLDGAGGWRSADEQRGGTAEAEVGLGQTFELGGQRGARIAGAEADIARVAALRDDAARRLLRDVAVAFLRALYAEERLRLAATTEQVAVEILRIAERRLQAGDIPKLDVNVSRAALSRARSEVRGAEALRDAAKGELRILLGMEAHEALSVRGDLKDRRRYELQELLARAPQRPDLRALVAEQAEANATVRLGEAMVWPDLGVAVRYERDEGANVALGGLSLTLPFFDHGQGVRAEAGARSRRLRIELDAGQRVVGVEVRTAFGVYRRRVEAAEELERNALPLLDGNEALAKRSYESGQLGLADFLVVRREVLGTRVDYLDRLLEAATAGIELEASAGVLR